MFGSVSNGIGASIIWVAQGKYLSNCVKICEEKSGMYASLFWTIALGSQIFSYLFNSIILGFCEPYVLFLVATLITLPGIFNFGILPDPELPQGYVEEKESSSESFRILVSLIKDDRMLKMYGLFFNSACAAATAQGLLMPFYCLILKDEPVSEQLRLSSLIMVVYGFGAMLGGQILGQANDRLGGSRAVSKVSLLLHLIIYGSLFLCNEIHQFNLLCFFSGFWIGAADSSLMTQLSLLIANYFTESAQVYALLNIVKNLSMSILVFIGSNVVTKENFRLYFLIVMCANIAF
jgi:MFS family permease